MGIALSVEKSPMFILSLAIELFAGTPIDFTQPNIRFSEIFTKGDGNPGLPQFIQEMITFLVGVAGILAIVMLLYSGFKRITSAGSSESVQEAGEIMWSALIGLFIALGSVFFLNTINPSLTTLHPLDFKNLTIQDSKNAKGVKVEIEQERIGGGGSSAAGSGGSRAHGRGGEWGTPIATVNPDTGKQYRLTNYWPVKGPGPARTEGRIQNSATPPAAGKEGVCTLEMLYRGECNYVSGAVGRDNPLFGKWAKVNVRKWLNNKGELHEARDFYIYFHDTGGDFQGNPNNIDIPNDTSNGDPQAATFDTRRGQPSNSDMTITPLDGLPPIIPFDPY